MAVHIQAGADATTALDIWIIRTSTGLLETPFALSYQIFDLSDATKIAAPEQVFPAVDGDTEPVDLELDMLGPGHFVARWESEAMASTGRYEIRWFVELDEGDDEREIRETFDVITGAVLTAQRPEGYALVSALRAEGVPSTVSDATLLLKIDLASRFIERVTRRRFAPYYVLDLPFDGTNMPSLRFADPVIALETLKRNYFESAEPEVVSVDRYVVYNRHITQGLISPDDRGDPRVTLKDYSLGSYNGVSYGRARSLYGRQTTVGGAQTYKVTGLFGYTEPDGSYVGGTPLGIVDVCKRLVILWLTPQYTAASSGNAGALNVKSETTRDQSVTYGTTTADKAGTGPWGEFTGSVELDQILGMYAAPSVDMP